MEISTEELKEIKSYLKSAYDMSLKEDWGGIYGTRLNCRFRNSL